MEKLTLNSVTVFAIATNQGNMGETDKILGYYAHEALAELDAEKDPCKKVQPVEAWVSDEGNLYFIKELGKPLDEEREPDIEVSENIKTKVSPAQLKYLKLDK
jgi:hypothetical protein